jgi:hypothetical protein
MGITYTNSRSNSFKIKHDFTSSNGCLDQFRKCAGLSHSAFSKESKSVTEEGLRCLEYGNASTTSE